jgi:hypothetical protein
LFFKPNPLNTLTWLTWNSIFAAIPFNQNYDSTVFIGEMNYIILVTCVLSSVAWKHASQWFPSTRSLVLQFD